MKVPPKNGNKESAAVLLRPSTAFPITNQVVTCLDPYICNNRRHLHPLINNVYCIHVRCTMKIIFQHSYLA